MLCLVGAGVAQGNTFCLPPAVWSSKPYVRGRRNCFFRLIFSLPLVLCEWFPASACRRSRVLQALHAWGARCIHISHFPSTPFIEVPFPPCLPVFLREAILPPQSSIIISPPLSGCREKAYQANACWSLHQIVRQESASVRSDATHCIAGHCCASRFELPMALLPKRARALMASFFTLPHSHPRNVGNAYRRE